MSVLWEMPLPESAQAHLHTARELNVSHFAPLAASIDAEQRYPWETVALLVDSGLSGLMVPREYGGAGESLLTACAVLEELSRACASTSGILSIHLMGGLPIESFGTPEQRSTYLPEILSGRAISFSLTERGAGSDPSHMRSTATRLPDGAWRLRGEKIYVGNGGSSSHYVVFVRTADSASTGAGLTAFLVSLTDDG